MQQTSLFERDFEPHSVANDGENLAFKNTTLDDIATVVGFTQTLRLSAWFGGLGSLYVPLRIDDALLLKRLIGDSAAQKMVAEWGGEIIPVPRLSQYDDDLVLRRVGRLLEHGMSVREIASSLKMSRRRIQQIRYRLESCGIIKVKIMGT